MDGTVLIGNCNQGDEVFAMFHSITFLPFDNLGASPVGHE